MSLKNPHKKRQPANFGCVTLAVILLFIPTGMLLTFWGVSSLKESRASLSWPSVTGKVVRVDVSREIRGGYYYYTPHITYQYILNDNRYTSQQIRISGDNTYSFEESAHEAVNMYALDSPVTVYYDPQEPDSALLEHQITGYGNLIAGIIFISMGITGILYPILSQKRRAKITRKNPK